MCTPPGGRPSRRRPGTRSTRWARVAGALVGNHFLAAKLQAKGHGRISMRCPNTSEAIEHNCTGACSSAARAGGTLLKRCRSTDLAQPGTCRLARGAPAACWRAPNSKPSSPHRFPCAETAAGRSITSRTIFTIRHAPAKAAAPWSCHVRTSCTPQSSTAICISSAISSLQRRCQWRSGGRGTGGRRCAGAAPRMMSWALGCRRTSQNAAPPAFAWKRECR